MFPRSFHIQFKACFESFKRNKSILFSTTDYFLICYFIIFSTKRVSHRGSLLKGVALHRVLYQTILNAKLTGMKKLDRKRCTSNRDDCKLENIQTHGRASQGVD